MMTVHRTLAALAVVVATVSAAPDRATSTDPTQAPTKAQTGSLDAYLALVESHEAGRSDEPVKTLSEWASLDIARAEAALLRLVAGAERGKYSMVLKRAALLHLDVLCGPWLPADVPLHLQVASRILDPIRRLPDHERFVRTWYLAAAGWMVEVDIWRAGVVLKQALALFPESPDVWLAAGALDEQLASPDVQWTIARAFPSRVSLPGSDPWVAGDYKDIDRNKGFRILGRSKELERAESELRRAVALDASLVEARLRLGRVLLEEGRLTEARSELEQVRAQAVEPFAMYHSLLFLGRLHQQANRVKEARECYEAAIAQYPNTQTPRVALSDLLRSAGDREGAISAIRSAVKIVPEPGPVEWWAQYQIGSRRLVEDRRADLAQMVAHVPKTPR